MRLVASGARRAVLIADTEGLQQLVVPLVRFRDPARIHCALVPARYAASVTGAAPSRALRLRTAELFESELLVAEHSLLVLRRQAPSSEQFFRGAQRLLVLPDPVGRNRVLIQDSPGIGSVIEE